MAKIIFVNDIYEPYDELWDSKPTIEGYEWLRYTLDYEVDDSVWASENLTEEEQSTFFVSCIPGVVIWKPEYTYAGVDETGDITLTQPAEWIPTGWEHLATGYDELEQPTNSEAQEPYSWDDLIGTINNLISL